MKARLQDGSVIVEVLDHPEDDKVYLTVSRARYDEDAVQIPLSRHVAKALGALLEGDE